MKTILIVEDNPAHMELATELFRHFGYETLCAADAEVGLRLARDKHPNLVLMDIQLPGMDGLAATRELKRDPATRAIPVIAVTSYLSEHPKRESRDAGCSGHIAKPYHYAELLATIEAAL